MASVLIAFFALFVIIFFVNCVTYNEMKNNSPEKLVKMYKEGMLQLNKEKNNGNLTKEKAKKINDDIKFIEKKISEFEFQAANNRIGWKEKIQKNLQRLEIEKVNAKINNDTVYEEQINGEIKLNKSYLEKNMNPNNITANSIIVSSYIIINNIFVVFIIVIIVSGIVSDEYSEKTIKILLTRPVPRSKIILSKFLSGALMSIIVIASAKFLNYLILSFLTGFGDFNMPMLVGTKYTSRIRIEAIINSSYIIPFWKYILEVLIIQVAFIICCSAICLLISTIFTSNITSFIINTLIMSLSIALFNISVTGHNLKLVKNILPYIFICYSDGGTIISGTLNRIYATSSITGIISIFILLIWASCAYFITNYIFKSKDMFI